MARKLSYKDEEGGMAKAQLLKIENYAKKLNEMIHPDDELEAWVQSKLSVVAAYMGDIKHYLDYELKKYGHGGAVSDFDLYEVEFKYKDAEESKKVKVFADDISDAQKIVEDKFGSYYDDFEILEIEKEEFDKDKEYEFSEGGEVMSFEEFKKKLPVLHNMAWGDKDGSGKDVEYKAKYNTYSGTTMYFKHGRKNSDKYSLSKAYEHYKYFAEKGEKFADGGSISELQNFDISELDTFEMFQYNDIRRKNPTMNKEDILQLLINNVEGDYSQLSPKLAEIAEENFGDEEYARGGYVGKAEMVWNKLNSSKRAEFLYENFTPEITPRSQEILVGKAYNFLPKNVKNKLQEKYANIEEYAKGGKVKDKWIQDALSGDGAGALRKTAKRKGLLKGDENLSMTDLKKLQKMGGKTAKRAHLAETLRKFDEGGDVDEDYKIVVGRDYYNGVDIYRVESVESDNEYVGEWHDNLEDANKELEDLNSKYNRGGDISEIDMKEVEESAKYYTDDSRWSTKPTINKFEQDIKEYQDLKEQLDRKEVKPSKIIGSGIKPQYARKLAYRWLDERILVSKKAIEILKERNK
jgi:hypothetical protein